ncbi:hypothetical protein EDB92DRAFT_1983067 [Lactarius akahatsu]|uniref:Uncharacterized protein n=1 Tax=Lactarius akahatsu TaxID=416441 RepID=A0AAD4QHI0_9AGAM|nr:hypothetical protein EDB92DRAFT_1983067 [Lactarius akahatsu]
MCPVSVINYEMFAEHLAAEARSPDICTEDKSHSENDKFLGPRAERPSLGGNKGSAVYSTPTVIELESQLKDINNFLTGRNVDATQKTCRFQEVDNLVHLGLRCESKQQLYAIRSAAFVWGRQTPSKFGSSSLRLLRRMSGHKEDWPGTLNGLHTAHYSSRAIIYRTPVININWEASGTAHGISSSAPISPHRVLIYQLESQSRVFYHRTTLGS